MSAVPPAAYVPMANAIHGAVCAETASDGDRRCLVYAIGASLLLSAIGEQFGVVIGKHVVAGGFTRDAAPSAAETADEYHAWIQTDERIFASRHYGVLRVWPFMPVPLYSLPIEHAAASDVRFTPDAAVTRSVAPGLLDGESMRTAVNVARRAALALGQPVDVARPTAVRFDWRSAAHFGVST